jgi:hypothetical protein
MATAMTRTTPNNLIVFIVALRLRNGHATAAL